MPRPYIPHARSPVMAVPGNRERIARGLVHSGRGIAYFRGLGAVPPGVISDEQIAASSSAPGGFVYHNVNVVQCALNQAGASLTVDGKWGPRTAAALADYVHGLVTQITPPDHWSNYVYQTPSAGAQVISLTQALYHSLTSGADLSACLGQMQAAVRPPPPPQTVAAPSASPAAPATHDWTMYGIAGAGVAALGIVGYVVWKSRKKRGRR